MVGKCANPECNAEFRYFNRSFVILIKDRFSRFKSEIHSHPATMSRLPSVKAGRSMQSCIFGCVSNARPGLSFASILLPA
jgi:hypothetical protein